MKRIHLLFISALAVLVCACGKLGAGTPDLSPDYLLTGECLASTELKHFQPGYESQQVDGQGFSFGFRLDISHTQQIHYQKCVLVNSRSFVIPSDDLFNSLGSNANNVKSKVEQLCRELKSSGFSRYNMNTIFFGKDISLTANKDFAGRKAGSNLADLIVSHPHLGASILGIPSDYPYMTNAEGLSFSIPTDGHELIEEYVRFKLSMLVRIVMYLHWLNDKISNPDAAVPYKDEVLHCEFTTKYRLK